MPTKAQHESITGSAWAELIALVRTLIAVLLDPGAHARAVELARRLRPLLVLVLAIILAWQLPFDELVSIVTGLVGG